MAKYFQKYAKKFPSSCTTQKMKFSSKNFFSKCDQNPQETVDLVTYTEVILNGKLHFLGSGIQFDRCKNIS